MQFADLWGPQITQGDQIEYAAAAAQDRFYPAGRTIHVVLGQPHAHYGDPNTQPALTLREITFTQRTRATRSERWQHPRGPRPRAVSRERVSQAP